MAPPKTGEARLSIDVPEELLRELKKRAIDAGVSLRQYVTQRLEGKGEDNAGTHSDPAGSRKPGARRS